MSGNFRIWPLFLSLLFCLLRVDASSLHGESDSIPLRPIEGSDSAVLHLEHNVLHFPKSHSSYDALYDRFRSLKSDDLASIHMLHIGGSHVQAGVFSNQMRSNLRAYTTKGEVGRGIIFPFSVMGTNGAKDIRCTSTGKWTKSRNIEQSPTSLLGLAGASVTTTDLSSSITFSQVPPFENLLLYGSSLVDTALVIPVLVVEGDTIYPPLASEEVGYEYLLPHPASEFTLAFVGDSCGSFALRGIIPEPYASGLMYTASGINGAAVPSWLRCTVFEQELSAVAPDLVLFAIGINDANVQSFSPDRFKENYRALIARIRRCNPDCTFLFITNNDCYLNVGRRKKSYNRNTALVEQAFIELAEEYDAAVWNLYQIMGGYGSSGKWVKAGLMQSDHIHFTSRGYQLLGDLLFNAIVKDYQDMKPLDVEPYN